VDPRLKPLAELLAEVVVRELEKGAADAGETPAAEMSLRLGRQDNDANFTTPTAPAP
jgi:hypothetical protein